MSVFRNLDCLSLLVCSHTNQLKLQTVLLLFFFQVLRSQIGGAAYTRTFTVYILLTQSSWLHGENNTRTLVTNLEHKVLKQLG